MEKEIKIPFEEKKMKKLFGWRPEVGKPYLEKIMSMIPKLPSILLVDFKHKTKNSSTSGGEIHVRMKVSNQFILNLDFTPLRPQRAKMVKMTSSLIHNHRDNI